MRSTVLLLACLLFLPLSAEAQDAPAASKWTDVDWYRVVQIDLEAGKTNAAMKLIDEHFAPATEAAGTPGPAMLLWHQTGEWDLTVMWTMAEGPGDMEWRRSPNNISWWSAFVAREGGEEAAEALWEEWNSMVERTNSFVALRRH